MEKTPQQKQAEFDYDNKLDALVDQGNSYDDARRRLGEPPYEIVETPVTPVQSEAVKANLGRRAVVAGRSHYPSRGPRGEEEGVGYPNGEPYYFKPVEEAILTDKQVETNERGLAEVRRVLDAAKANKEKKD